VNFSPCFVISFTNVKNIVTRAIKPIQSDVKKVDATKTAKIEHKIKKSIFCKNKLLS